PFKTQSESAGRPTKPQSPRPSMSKGGTSTAVETTDGGDDAAAARHPSAAAGDIEVESQRAGSFPLVGAGNDPYGLSRRYKPASQLAEIKANTSRKRDSAQRGPGVSAKASRVSGLSR